MASVTEVLHQRGNIVHQARAFLERSYSQGATLRAEDEQGADRAFSDLDKLDAELRQVDRETARERRSRDRNRPDRRNTMAAYREFIVDGTVGTAIEPHQGAYRHITPGRGESRDTVVTTASKGGFLVLPTEISAEVVSPNGDNCFIRRVVDAAGSLTKVKRAQKLGVRVRTARQSDSDWTTEVAAASEDTTGAYGRRDLEPQELSKLCLVSLRAVTISVEPEKDIEQELSYKFSITEEKAYMSGDGAGKPLGIFTANANGISTARDVAAASSTVVAADDLVNLVASLKPGYTADPSCRWAVSRAFIQKVRKLKLSSTSGGDDLGYVWSPGLTNGQPDKILDIGYETSEFVPNTFTTGLYIAALGAFRYYQIAELDVMTLQRLTELYVASAQVGFIGRRWIDGAPVVEEAFSRLRMA
jgi:HK97 family phage major capsid protein